MNTDAFSFVNMHTMILIAVGFIALVVIVMVVLIVFSAGQRKKLQEAQDELARLEGRLVSGGKLTEAEGVRLVQLQQQVQNIRDRQRNAAIQSAGAVAANQINMRGGL